MNLQKRLARFNSLPSGEAERELLKCCGSKEWARLTIAARPFANFDELSAKAEQVWWSLASPDWLEAFHSHPKIGEKKAATGTSDQSKRWSEAEQAEVNTAAEDRLR